MNKLLAWTIAALAGAFAAEAAEAAESSAPPALAIPEFPLRAPTARQQRQETAAEIDRRLLADREKIAGIAADFQPSAIPFLAAIVADPLHPFAPAALQILIAHPLPASRQVIVATLDAERAEMRLAAFNALWQWRNAELITTARAAALKFLRDADPRLRLAAIAACGEIRAAAPQLRELLEQSPPLMQIYAAAALMRLEPDGGGRKFLEKIGMLEDAALAPAALNFLGSFADERAAGYFFARLNSPWLTIVAAAANNLRRLPASVRERVLNSREPEAQLLLSARLTLANFLAAAPDEKPAEKLPFAACRHVIMSGNRNDLHLALAAWRKQPAVANIPLLIALLTNSPREIAEKTLSWLTVYLRDAELAPPPTDYYSAAAWEEWWFAQYRVLAATDRQALLQSPDGDTRVVGLNETLDFSARIIAITGDSRPQVGSRPQVAVAADGRTYYLKSN
ncbi:MAG: hypothetical protein LBP75_00485 [Planctomycetota bacterium]|jgi:hypothetical protein|nr:hypothetical protein [Planctomycetota bacterium]